MIGNLKLHCTYIYPPQYPHKYSDFLASLIQSPIFRPPSNIWTLSRRRLLNSEVIYQSYWILRSTGFALTYRRECDALMREVIARYYSRFNGIDTWWTRDVTFCQTVDPTKRHILEIFLCKYIPNINRVKRRSKSMSYNLKILGNGQAWRQWTPSVSC